MSNPHWSVDSGYPALKTVRGLFHPLHFVVRLKKDFLECLESRESDFYEAGDLDDESIDAFSTFFHETIHWWQHVGSTSGLLLSLAYPGASHINHRDLLRLLEDVGPVKSLASLNQHQGLHLAARPRDCLNRVLNNWHDGHFNYQLTLDPHKIHLLVNDPYFDCVGHSLQIGLGHALWLLQSTVDKDCSCLPDIRKWEQPFAKLRSERVEGFYRGSPVRKAPIGALHIFEGQARFHQLQYLYLAHRRQASWEEFERRGMMGDVYTAAFQWFLDCTGLQWPESPIASVVQLFLLVCDLSINPSDGYPFDIRHFESFLPSVDPGLRFTVMCWEIAKNKRFKDLFATCGRAEYEEGSLQLCRSLACHTPTENAAEIVRWSKSSDGIRAVLAEESGFTFSDENLPVRVYFSKHVRFSEDRLECPEFFCWPAMYLVSNETTSPDLNRSQMLWERHKPLFVATLDGEIKPTLTAHKKEADIYETFNRFYSWNALYSVVQQWIIADGPFDYQFEWLTRKYSESEMKHWVDSTFRHAFGVSPDDFTMM